MNPGTAACHAPQVNLHLDPQGWVAACAANKRQPIGHVADAPLLDIWRGATAARFRANFANGGIAAGCEMCRWQRETSGDDAMYARIYDHLAPDADPDWPRHAEFTLSSDCNLRCQMCNGAFSSSIRIHREGLTTKPSPYDDAFFAQLPPILDHLITAKFLGGEPFMAIENLRVWELMAEATARPTCHVTTNGTIYSRRVQAVLDEVPMSFAVSIDGATAATVERIRVGVRFRDLMDNIERLAEHTSRHGTSLSFTYCLMTENWHELGAFLEMADRFDVSVYVNTVTSPVRLSLYHLPQNQLAEVIATLDASDLDQRERLGRNREVWIDQIERLHQAYDAPINDGETPVHFPGFRHPPLIETRSPPGPTQAEEILAAWSDQRDLAALIVTSEGTIVEVEGSLPGVNLDRIVGLGIDELYLWLQSAFGQLGASTYLRHAPDAGDRILRFTDLTEVLEVRMISGATPAGDAWWKLAGRTSAIDGAQHRRPGFVDR